MLRGQTTIPEGPEGLERFKQNVIMKGRWGNDNEIWRAWRE